MLPDAIKEMFDDYDTAKITREQFYTLLNLHSQSQHDGKPIVSGSLPLTDAEYKKLMKVLYPVDNSKKFRRQ